MRGVEEDHVQQEGHSCQWEGPAKMLYMLEPYDAKYVQAFEDWFGIAPTPVRHPAFTGSNLLTKLPYSYFRVRGSWADGPRVLD